MSLMVIGLRLVVLAVAVGVPGLTKPVDPTVLETLLARISSALKH
jgi:hypothetical protein